jgi:hypothetical protein
MAKEKLAVFLGTVRGYFLLQFYLLIPNYGPSQSHWKVPLKLKDGISFYIFLNGWWYHLQT